MNNTPPVAKKKTKQSDFERRKLAEAKSKNDFMLKLKQVCASIDGELYAAFTRLHLDILYLSRGTMINLMAKHPSPFLTRSLLADLERCFKYELDEEKMVLVEGKPPVTYSDYMYVIHPLERLIKDTKYFPPLWKERLADFSAGEAERFAEYFHKVDLLCIFFMHFVSDMSHRKYHMKFEDPFPAGKKWHDFRMMQTVTIDEIRLKREKLTFAGGEVRSAIRVVNLTFRQRGDATDYNDSKYEDFNLKPSVLGIKGHFAEIPLPVYIQQHALSRLSERIGLMGNGLAQQDAIRSLSEGKTARGRNGQLLVEFSTYGKKAGYLAVDVIEGVILVRTFLFLTNNSTPEGQMLEEQLGLKKLDKQYLTIDKLQTLVNSDILRDEEICGLFRKAGCGELLELCEELKTNSIPFEKRSGEEMQLAFKIRKYLQPVLEDLEQQKSEEDVEQQIPEEAEQATEN